MLNWIAGTLLAMVNVVPALFVAEDSPNFVLVRAMFGLMFIVLIVFAIAMFRPFCSAIARMRAGGPSRIMPER